MDAKLVGERIGSARKARGLTQKALAKKLMVTDKAVSKWERGLNYPDIELFEPLARILEVSMTFLICGEDGGNENVVKAAAEISVEEKKAQRRSMYGCVLCSVIIGAAVFGAALTDSYLLYCRGIYGICQGILGGIISGAGILIGNAVRMFILYRKEMKRSEALKCRTDRSSKALKP